MANGTDARTQRHLTVLDIPYLDIPPLMAAGGTVQLPGSKSISNRVLLLAAMAKGTTRLHDLLDSDDTQVMLQSLRTLGCQFEHRGSTLEVTGLAGDLRVHEADLFLGNAGTAMRPLAAALAVLAATQGGRFDLRGVPRMHERPIGDLVDALRPLGCQIEDLGQSGYPPLRLKGRAGGALHIETPIRVRGDVSSQFLTALLLALPLARSTKAVHIEVVGELISKPYVEITLSLMARFGVHVVRQGWQRFTIEPGASYQATEIHVEADASSASYFIAVGALAASPEQPVRIQGVGKDSIQGDMAFAEAATAMGADIRMGAGWVQAHRGRWPLRGITWDCTAIPDAAMTLAAMALYADSPTRLNGIGSWRVKETDRIAAMATELRKVGAQVVAGPDFIEIAPLATPAQHWRDAQIHTYDDHRMAMCLSLAAFNPMLGARKVTRILDPRCVGKTFPDYFETFLSVVRAHADDVPVIAIDGPTASGKGTLASEIAARLGWHLLDSGALYRATGLAASWDGVAADDEAGLAQVAAQLDLKFGQGEDAGRVWLRHREVTNDLRAEATGLLASKVSAWPAVRQALHELQLSFRRAPGLVADGRDMGTVVFPQAALKVFLTADAEQRALRRHKQLISKGISANIDSLRADLLARDAQDKNRSVAPCIPAQDAQLLDNSNLGIEESVQLVLNWWQSRGPFGLQ